MKDSKCQKVSTDSFDRINKENRQFHPDEKTFSKWTCPVEERTISYPKSSFDFKIIIWTIGGFENRI